MCAARKQLLLIKLFAGLCLAADAITGLAATNEVRVGSTTFFIPTPEGSAPVTKEMARLTLALDLNAASFGKRLISFIPESYAASAKEGLPDYDRSFHVEIAKDMLEARVSSDWFLDYKVKTRSLLTELTKPDQRRLPSELAGVEKRLKELDERESDLGLAIDSVTFPPHQESDRIFAYSALTRSEDNSRQATRQTTANTVAALFVKEKVIMVLVSGGKYDLAWTRAACSNWTAAILAVNDSAVGASPPSRHTSALPIESGKRPGELPLHGP
jgi:hypothetical protein